MNIKATWQGKSDLGRDFASLTKGMQGQALRGALRAAASPVVKGAQADSPSRRVKKALTSIVRGHGAWAAEARIGAKKKTPGAKLLHLIEKGTRPHIIEAKNKSVMAITHTLRSRGRRAQYDPGIVFGKRVRHPGTQPRSFFRRQLPENRAESERKFRSALAQIVARIRLRLLKKR